MADPLEALIERDHEEEEEGDIRHAADNGDITFAKPAERPEMRARRRSAAETKEKGGRGCDGQQ